MGRDDDVDRRGGTSGSPGAEAPGSLDPAVGLCSLCRHAERSGNRRGSVFWRCGLADRDPELLRYPPLPVARCRGYAPTGSRREGEPTV